MKKLILTVLTVAISVFITACAPPENAAADGKIKLAFITNAPADFWKYCQAGVEKAEAELGDVDVQFKVGDNTPNRNRLLTT